MGSRASSDTFLDTPVVAVGPGGIAARYATQPLPDDGRRPPHTGCTDYVCPDCPADDAMIDYLCDRRVQASVR